MKRWITSCALLLASGLCGWADSGGHYYKTPKEAVAAFESAATARDQGRIVKIFGPQVKELLEGTPAQQAESMRLLSLLFKEGWRLASTQDQAKILRLGREGWTFPVPLQHTKAGWQFDTKQGFEEILNRRVGRNELLTIQTCLRVMEAQASYRKKDQDGDGAPAYATKMLSSADKHDGLYWVAKGKDISPLQKALGDAFRFAEGRIQGSPWFGYYYRMTADGANGFAVIAYPVNYGKSGVMSFICNQEGKVLQKDLGATTLDVVKNLDPIQADDSWTPVLDEEP